MKNYKDSGEKIKFLRLSHNKNLTDLSEAIQVDKSYLSKIENGLIRPSSNIISKLGRYFSLSPLEINDLMQLAGYGSTSKKEGILKDSISFEEKEQPQTNKIKLSFKMPENLPILYSDSIAVTGSVYGIVFDVAQRMGSTEHYTVVSRIGVSLSHAKALLKVLSKKIIDTERLIDKTQKENSGN